MNTGQFYKFKNNFELLSNLIIAFLALMTGIFITFSYKVLAIEIGLSFILISFIFLTKNFTPIILLFLVLRPIVDIWTEYRIDFIGIQMFMTVSIIFAIIFYLMTNKNKHTMEKIYRDPVVILFILYLLVNFLSIAINPKISIMESLSLVFRFVSFLSMYLWGLVLFKTEQKRDWVIVSYICAMFPISIVGYYQLATGAFHQARGVLGIQATFGHPNMFANYLIIASLACIYFILQKKNMLFNLIILGSNLFLFSQTYSRMALAVFLLIICILSFIYRKNTIYFFPVIFILTVFIYYKLPSIIGFWSYRFATISSPDALIMDRSSIFSALINLFEQNPIIGIGPATFYPHYFRYAQPHNEFLRNLAEVGLMGTIPFVLMWGIIIKRFLSFGSIKDTNYKLQKFIIFLMILTVVLISLTSNIGTNPELLWPLFVLIGGYVNCDEIKIKQL